MPRKRGHDDGKSARNGAKTDESAHGSKRPQRAAPRNAKQRSSEIARATPYGGDRDRRRTS